MNIWQDPRPTITYNVEAMCSGQQVRFMAFGHDPDDMMHQEDFVAKGIAVTKIQAYSIYYPSTGKTEYVKAKT